MSIHEQRKTAQAGLDELLRRMDSASKGPETADFEEFLSGVIRKGGRIQDGRVACTVSKPAAAWGRADLEAALLMLAAIPFLVAGIGNPAYLLVACSASTVWALKRGIS